MSLSSHSIYGPKSSYEINAKLHLLEGNEWEMIGRCAGVWKLHGPCNNIFIKGRITDKYCCHACSIRRRHDKRNREKAA